VWKLHRLLKSIISGKGPQFVAGLIQKLNQMLEGWRAAITVGTNDGPLTRLSNR